MLRTESQVSASVGIGLSSGHHGEILQGVFYAEDGKLHRGLVTLPRNDITCLARFIPDWTDEVKVAPLEKSKAKKAAELTGILLTEKVVGGTLYIDNPLPVGRGMGSSTMDVVAAISAVSNSCQCQLTTYDIANLAVQAEVASDAVMFPSHTVLFAHREGKVLRHLEGPLPPMYVIGTDCPINDVDTLNFKPAHYSQEEIEQFRVLLGLLSYGIKMQDAVLVGKVATASAKINQRFLPKPNFQEFLHLAKKTGAVGVQVAHSGTVIGLMYNRREQGITDKIQRALDILLATGYSPYQFMV